MRKKDKIKKQCIECNNYFEVHEYRAETAKFCSQECKTTSQKGIDIFKGNDRLWLIGNKNAKGVPPNKTSFVEGQIPWNRGIRYEAITGANNWNWNGGITQENEIIRKSFTYKEWRIAVFERDTYSCKLCGSSESGTLNAHHIKKFSDYPELRFKVSNGITLCEDCHNQVTGCEEDYDKELSSLLIVYMAIRE